MGDAQHVTVREQRVDDMVQFQPVPITVMVWDKEIEIDDNISVPCEEMKSKQREEDLKRKAEQQKEYRKEIGRNDNRRRRRTKKTKGRSKQRISKKKVGRIDNSRTRRTKKMKC